MRLAALSAAVLLATVMGCDSPPPAPPVKTVQPPAKATKPALETVQIEIVVAEDATSVKFMVYHREYNDADITIMLKDRLASLGPVQDLIVEVKVGPKAAYADLARVLLAGGRAEIEHVTLNGQPIWLPPTTALADGKALARRAILIKVFEVGPQGKYVPDGENADCSLRMSSVDAGTSFKFEISEKESGAAKKPKKPLPKKDGEDLNLGMDFGALLANLKKQVKDGMPADTPILIRPTLGCQCEWVLKVVESCQSAGLNDIRFVISFRDEWE